MKAMENLVQQQFGLHIEGMIAGAEGLSELICKAGQRLVDSLLKDGKILIGAQGASCANGLHFSSALLNRYDVERPSLPAINLSSHLGFSQEGYHDAGGDPLLSRQILALGQPDDTLVLLTTNGQAATLVSALDAAHERAVSVIVLSGHTGGLLPAHLKSPDLEIRVPLSHPARIREIHLFILHCFCHVIEYALFGHGGDAQ